MTLQILVNNVVKQTIHVNNSTVGLTRLVLAKNDVVTVKVLTPIDSIYVQPTSYLALERVRQFR